MARAFVELFTVTNDRAWLKHAEETLAVHREELFERRFAGVCHGQAESGSQFRQQPQRDENSALCRAANLVFQ